MNFEFLNPFYNRIESEDDKKTEFVQTYSILLLNFLEHVQLLDLEDLNVEGKKKSDMYLDCICKLYNHWIKNTKDSFKHFEFTVPKFFTEEKFKVNKSKIKNETTKKMIENDEKKEYAFRSILGSFNKPRKKPIGIFTSTTVGLFNDMVYKIDDFLEQQLKLNRDSKLKKNDLMNFGDFHQVSYDQDAAGVVYPDIYGRVEDEGSNKKGKKKAYPTISKK